MLTPFQKMRAHRSRWVAQPIKAQESDAWRLKAMVVDGVAYVERPMQRGCRDCAFKGQSIDVCSKVFPFAFAAFGGSCGARNVTYIKAE